VSNRYDLHVLVKHGCDLLIPNVTEELAGKVMQELKPGERDTVYTITLEGSNGYSINVENVSAVVFKVREAQG
jgi:hypothetical protein